MFSKKLGLSTRFLTIRSTRKFTCLKPKNRLLKSFDYCNTDPPQATGGKHSFQPKHMKKSTFPSTVFGTIMLCFLTEVEVAQIGRTQQPLSVKSSTRWPSNTINVWETERRRLRHVKYACLFLFNFQVHLVSQMCNKIV